MKLAAVITLWLVAVYLMAGGLLAILTTDRPRRAFPLRDSLVLAGVRIALAVAVCAAAVWVAKR